MNGKPTPSNLPPDELHAAVQGLARAFEYPPTPDLVAGVRVRLGNGREARTTSRPRRLAWVLVALALALAALLAVPQVRAAIADILQIGGIRIFLTSPTPTPIPPTATPAPAAAVPVPVTETPPRPSPTALPSVLDLAGETTLDLARRSADFAIGLPAYPVGLGEPDHVFLQQLGGPMVVLVWTAPDRPDKVTLSLHEFGPGTYAEKFEPKVVQETTVNGLRALWTEGAHLFVFKSGDVGLRELVHGHTLIWQQGEVTYRLETDAGLDEVVRIAESVH